MNLFTSKFLPFLALAFTILLTASCEDSSTGVDPETKLEVQVVEDLDANADAERGAAPEFTFYSLRNNAVVTDSASAEWDIAFSGTTILVNNGTSGPGNGGAVVLDVAFDEIRIAPSEGYRVDTDTLLAIPTGDENGWYNYIQPPASPAHAILPIENKTIVLKTADGNHYAKLEIISYYKGNPDITSSKFADTDTRADDRYYTFKYVLQKDGSRELK